MFTKILIANRGEIACRVIKTAQKMGIQCVAVYSEVDRSARFVEMADEAWLLGPAEAGQSYLRMDKIIDIALSSGAQAIHPGYGFLSENAQFSRLCEEKGLVFIGPSPESIEAMGSKSAAKQLLESTQVPLVPGYHGEIQTLEFLLQQADRIGYPVLLKASAGGGGKGMRVVSEAQDFASALAAARREAKSAFGNDHILLEKFILEPRHVEVQILCDHYGNSVYVQDRDCSIQRRHQKVVEEAPAPGISESVRQAMGSAALDCARSIQYRGVGTIEFLLDANENFYFMEMNTRLQVEHPVTEMISGLDLVEWQLRVASGAKLPFTQKDIKSHGHAFEVRLYAESPLDNFLPSSGRISHLRFPEESSYVRVDTGIRSGDEISSFYDPMIAKLIVWGETRTIALSRMMTALNQTRIGGVSNNLAFLGHIFRNADFQAAQISTFFIEEHQHSLLAVSEISKELVLKAGIAHVCYAYGNLEDPKTRAVSDRYSPWEQARAWRINAPANETFELSYQDKLFHYQVTFLEGNHPEGSVGFRLEYLNERVEVTAVLSEPLIHADFGTHQISISAEKEDHGFTLYHQSQDYTFIEKPLFHSNTEQEKQHGLAAPMHGKVIAVLVERGQRVKQGDILLIMEAMKMEHSIRANAEGTVKELLYHAGDRVAEGALLIDLDIEEKE